MHILSAEKPSVLFWTRRFSTYLFWVLCTAKKNKKIAGVIAALQLLYNIPARLFKVHFFVFVFLLLLPQNGIGTPTDWPTNTVINVACTLQIELSAAFAPVWQSRGTWDSSGPPGDNELSQSYSASTFALQTPLWCTRKNFPSKLWALPLGPWRKPCSKRLRLLQCC